MTVLTYVTLICHNVNPHARYVFQTAPTCVKPDAPADPPVSFGEHIQQMIEKTYAA